MKFDFKEKYISKSFYIIITSTNLKPDYYALLKRKKTVLEGRQIENPTLF